MNNEMVAKFGATILLYHHLDYLEYTLNSLIGAVDVLFTLDASDRKTVNQLTLQDWTDKHNIRLCYQTSEFTNFGAAKTELMKLAENKAEYLILMEVGEILTKKCDMDSIKNDIEKLNMDMYQVAFQFPLTSLINTGIVKGTLVWKWYGFAHEFIGRTNSNSQTVDAHTSTKYENLVIERVPELYSNQWRNYSLDETLLLEQVRENHAVLFSHDVRGFRPFALCFRAFYYLAQTYWEQEKYAQAFKYYQERAKYREGFGEEIYISLLRSADCQQFMNSDKFELALGLYLKAYDYSCETRKPQPEPLIEIAKHYLKERQYYNAYMFIQAAGNVSASENTLLFASNKLDYDFTIPYLKSQICYFVNKREEGKINCITAILNSPSTEYRVITYSNLRFYPLEATDFFRLFFSECIFIQDNSWSLIRLEEPSKISPDTNKKQIKLLIGKYLNWIGLEVAKILSIPFLYSKIISRYISMN